MAQRFAFAPTALITLALLPLLLLSMSPFLNRAPQPRPMLGGFRTGAGTISLSWSCGVRVSLHKPVAESIRGSRPCKSARTGHPPVSVTLARSRATGSTPLGRPVFTTEAQSHREKMNERRSFGPNSPTQAKTGLEWATRPYTNQSLKAFVVPALAKSARTGHPLVSVTLARSRATGSTPLGRPVFTTEARSH